MSETEIKMSATKLMIVISAITGWLLPTDEMHLGILKDQLEKKLVEGYGNMNVEEMSYAFRNYPVKDWGKSLNLNLIDEVLETYLEKRSELSRIEESKEPVEQKIYTDEEIKNHRREEIELKYQAMRGGRVLEIPAYLEEVLREDGLLKEETVGEFFVRLLNNKVENIYKKESDSK